MIGVLLSLLTSLPGVANGVLSWLNKKTDADLEKFKAGVSGDTAINVEDIRARVEITKLATEQRKLDREHWATRWMVPAAFFVFMGHVTAVALYSIFWCKKCAYPQPWEIAALPAPMDGWQGSVILTICGVAAAVPTIKRIFTK